MMTLLSKGCLHVWKDLIGDGSAARRGCELFGGGGGDGDVDSTELMEANAKKMERTDRWSCVNVLLLSALH